MNFLYKSLCILAFFTIAPATARTFGSRPATPPQQTPAQPIQPPMPIPQPPAPAQVQKTYIALRNDIATRNPNTIFNNNTKLFETKFIQEMINTTKSSALGKTGLKFLLQFARDKHYQFTNDNDNNRLLIEKMNSQINNAIAQL